MDTVATSKPSLHGLFLRSPEGPAREVYLLQGRSCDTVVVVSSEIEVMVAALLSLRCNRTWPEGDVSDAATSARSFESNFEAQGIMSRVFNVSESADCEFFFILRLENLKVDFLRLLC